MPTAYNHSEPVKIPFFTPVGHGIDKFHRILSYFSAAGMFIMMVPTVADVLIRLILGEQLSGRIEFTGLVMAFVIYLGVPYAQAKRSHVRVTFVVDRLPPMVKQTLEVLVYLFSLCVFAFVIYATTDEAIRSIQIGEYQYGSVRFPIWPSRLLVAFGVILLSLQFIVDLFRALYGLVQRRVTS
ncbi:TRAP transporter small permease subunit [Thermodesulfobacteriota bacterium]